MNSIKEESLSSDFNSMDVSSNANLDDYPQYRDSNIFGASYGYGSYTGFIYNFGHHVGPLYLHHVTCSQLGFLENVTNQEYDYHLRHYMHMYQHSMTWPEYCAHLEGYRHHH